MLLPTRTACPYRRPLRRPGRLRSRSPRDAGLWRRHDRSVQTRRSATIRTSRSPARRSASRSISTRRSPKDGGHGGRAAAAPALPERERRHVEALSLWMGGRANDAIGLMKAILAAHPRDVVLIQRLYFVYFWQGRSADMLDLTSTVGPAFEDDSYVLGLHAFSLEENRHFDEALLACRAGDGAQSEGRVGRPRHGPRALRARGQRPRHRGAAAEDPSRATTSGTSRITCSGTSPSCTWPTAATSASRRCSRACSAGSRSPSPRTCRIPCRSPGGSTSSAIRIRRAGSALAPQRARWLDLPLLLFHDLTWHGAGRRRGTGHRPTPSRSPRGARQEDAEPHAARGGRAAARRPARLRARRLRATAASGIEPIEARIVEVGAATPSARSSTTRCLPPPFAPTWRTARSRCRRRLGKRPNPGHYWTTVGRPPRGHAVMTEHSAVAGA